MVSHFHPEVNALTNRLESLIPLLGQHNDIHAAYLSLDEPSPEVQQAFNEKMGVNITHYAVVVVPYNRDGFLGRTWGELRNNWRLWRAARRVESDVLFQSVPQLMLLPVSAFFVPFDRANRKILEIRDLTWDYIDYGSGPIGRLVARLVAKVAAFAVGRFDEVIACTEGQAAFVRENTNCPAAVVRNGIAREKFLDLADVGSNRQPGDSFSICYFGTFGHAQNLITLVQAAELVADINDIEIKLFGAGPEERKLREFVASRGIGNVEFVEKMSWDRLLAYYATADVLYAQLKAGDAFATAEPSKLFEYFSTGKAVIYGGQGLSAALASRFSNAVVVEPDDPDALASAIRDLHKIRPGISSSDIELVRKEFVREAIFESYLREANLK